jgi:hypothetical protein
MCSLRTVAFAFGALALGCNLVPPAPAEPEPRPVAAKTAKPHVHDPSLPMPTGEPFAAPGADGKQRLGKAILGTERVTLAAVAADPKAFNHKSIVTEGVVKKVCQEAGCWMAIADERHDAVVRMAGHAFFIPKDAAGRRARVEGRVLLVKDGKECDEAEAEHAQLSMEATGVELAVR